MPTTKRPKLEKPVVVLTVDTLTNLVERVVALETKCKALQSQAESNFDTLCEYIPHVEGDKLKLTAWESDDTQAEVLVSFERSDDATD